MPQSRADDYDQALLSSLGLAGSALEHKWNVERAMLGYPDTIENRIRQACEEYATSGYDVHWLESELDAIMGLKPPEQKKVDWMEDELHAVAS